MLFVFDENLPHHLAEGLNKLEEGNTKSPNKVVVKHALEISPKGSTDEDLIAKIGQLQGILFTQDKDFKNKKHYYSLYKTHNIGIVIYTIQNKDIYWDKVVSFVKNWEEIKHKVCKSEIPFVFNIGKTGGVTTLKF